ncbi:hypothetical protein [Kitasatospora sp. NPDC059673]|uniref:hypothetical protein n=1 Tax=Kitasatospora sp. NPDC059673 TaxID=3346901 RepID=UPI0036C2385C
MTSPPDYARWVYEKTRDWGMWQPFETLDLGDVGYFTNEKLFVATDSTAMDLLGVRPTRGTRHSVSNLVFGNHKDFEISGHGEGGVAEIGATLTVSMGKEKGFLLYIAEGHTQKIRNISLLLSGMRDELLAKNWRLNYALVGKHLVATEGFAAIFKEGNASLSFTVKAPVSVNQSLPATVKAGADFKRSSGEVQLFTFGDTSTPTFGCTWRVRSDLRDALLDGRVDKTPQQDLVYSDRSRITKEEILSHPPDWLFEKQYTFESLP